MEIDASLLIAIGAILTSVFTFVSQQSANKRTVHKDEVDLLRDEVARLDKRLTESTNANDEWRKKYDRLYQYVLMLRKVLIDNHLDVPNMDIFDDEGFSPRDASTHPEKNLIRK